MNRKAQTQLREHQRRLANLEAGETIILEVPEGVEGIDAAMQFDRTAIALGHLEFMRDIIPGEFAVTVNGIAGEAYARKEATAHGLEARVLVHAVTDGVRTRCLVMSYRLRDGVQA